MLGEIVVTAQHRTENLQKVPISESALSGATLAHRNINSIQDLEGAVPSLVVSRDISYGTAPITIRGLGGPSGGGSLFEDQPVAVYVDGVYVAALGQSIENFLDVDNIQVLRGPQGTLYGRNSTSGAILLTTKRPTNTFGGEIDGTYGSFDYSSLSGVLNAPLIPDVLATRVALSENAGGDWANNTVDGRKFGGGRNTTGRISLRFTPTKALTADLILDHADGYSRPATVSLAQTTLINAGPLGMVYAGDPYQRRPDFNSVLKSNDVQIVGSQFARTRSNDATFLVHYNAGAVQLDSITGYRDFTVSGAQATSPYTIPAGLTNTNTVYQDEKSYSEEIRLSSSDRANFKWTAGLYYFNEEIGGAIDLLEYQAGAPVATGFGARGPIFTGQVSGLNALYSDSEIVNSYAAFADGTYNFNDQYAVTGGLRYSRDDKSATVGQLITTMIPTVLLANPVVQGSCPSSGESCKASFDNVSPRVVFNDKLTPNNFLYVSFSEGFNSGGFNNFGDVTDPTDPTNPLAYSSERISNYEIGSKNEFFDHKFRLNVTGFVSDYTDLQIRQAVITGGVAVVNVPRSQVKGVEVESLLNPLRGLTITLNGSYLDAQIQKGVLASLPSNVGFIIPGQQTAVTPENVAGDSLTRAPKFQGLVSVNYRYPTQYGAINGAATVHGQTKTYFAETNQNTDQYVASGWTEVDLRLSLQDIGDRWELAFYAKNLLNNRYLTQIAPYTGFPIGTLNTPQNFGVSFSDKF